MQINIKSGDTRRLAEQLLQAGFGEDETIQNEVLDELETVQDEELRNLASNISDVNGA